VLGLRVRAKPPVAAAHGRRVPNVGGSGRLRSDEKLREKEGKWSEEVGNRVGKGEGGAG
jgi:hypothetical protein